MELPDRDICYRALQSRDARFDGLMYVGVSSTGVYCRPICPARSPADSDLFHPFGGIEETVARLKAIRGIGEWTAQYIALRAVREMDAFPATDIGLLRGAACIGGMKATPANLLTRSESWRPWRAYAAQHLWAAGRNMASKNSYAAD